MTRAKRISKESLLSPASRLRNHIFIVHGKGTVHDKSLLIGILGGLHNSFDLERVDSMPKLFGISE